MTAVKQGVPPDQWLSEQSTADDVRAIESFLKEQGTFRFPTFSSGLFSAAAADHADFELTGYQSVWVRDNMHIAHALWVTGHGDGISAVSAVAKFFHTTQQRFRDIIDGKALKTEVAKRPHIRFAGETLTELSEQWAHAQNDALGYFLWLASKMLRSGDMELTAELEAVLPLLVQYLHAIEYWQDEDSGHWEETKKIEASSIGVVVAGLRELQAYLRETGRQDWIPALALEACLLKGEAALAEILPAECIQKDPSQYRRYDAALLFLIYPLAVVPAEMALQIVEETVEHLSAPIGIRRYIGDSYWCANYRDLLSPETRTTDYSEDTSGRDKLLNAGEEAQWCIFDPIVSVIFAQRFMALNAEPDRERMLHHLRRSLAQLTTAETRFKPYRCPESYFLEHGKWIPNDICPLLWTQANLLLALHWAKQALA